MYKNKVKEWRLSKYLKADKAQQILDGTLSANETASEPALTVDEDAVKRAERSLKRKRARERTQSHLPPPVDSAIHAEPESYIESPITPNINMAVPWRTEQPTSVPQNLRISEAGEKFLLNLRKWTHDAFLSGQWDTKLSAKHHSGRQASRSLSMDLTAGTNLFKKGKEQLAWTYWKRANANFGNPDLFKTWYYETPIRLLFEMGRLVHDGHSPLAASLLRSIKDWANQNLDENDSRRALFSVFGDLDPAELRQLYDRAARSLYKGLESRIDKNHPLLVEIRLNRALDLVYFDADADLTEWMPPIEEVDKACGPSTIYAVYFLLLQGYRLVAQDKYTEADAVCAEARNRLTALTDEKSIDPWRVGLAYRRLGRVQQSKKRYPDARRSFNTALRYVGTGNKESGAILIEICQYQESMAMELGDEEDAALWTHMLKQLEKQAADLEEAELSQQKKLLAPPPEEPKLLAPEDAIDGEDSKRICLSRSPSPRSIKRTNTL